jgi:hypothetical protein
MKASQALRTFFSSSIPAFPNGVLCNRDQPDWLPLSCRHVPTQTLPGCMGCLDTGLRGSSRIMALIARGRGRTD